MLNAAGGNRALQHNNSKAKTWYRVTFLCPAHQGLVCMENVRKNMVIQARIWGSSLSAARFRIFSALYNASSPVSRNLRWSCSVFCVSMTSWFIFVEFTSGLIIDGRMSALWRTGPLTV